MHKNPHQNAGNAIKETLFFKIFLGSIPPDPLELGKFVSAPQSPYAYDSISKNIMEKDLVSKLNWRLSFYCGVPVAERCLKISLIIAT